MPYLLLRIEYGNTRSEYISPFEFFFGGSKSSSSVSITVDIETGNTVFVYDAHKTVNIF